MKLPFNRRLFWFLKDETKLDLEKPAVLETYVQQVITHGKTSDVKALLKIIKPIKLKRTIDHLKGFLPKEVAKFWEDYFGSTLPTPKRAS
jgi:hypothetical protein